MFSEVFFSFCFFKGEFQKETSPKQKKYVRVPTPFLSECQYIAAPVLESGCKVGLYNIQAKYIRGFFRISLEHFYKTLIDKRVEEHIFLKYKHKGERDEKRNTL